MPLSPFFREFSWILPILVDMSKVLKAAAGRRQKRYQLGFCWRGPLLFCHIATRTDKASGIVNDANDFANETMSNPAYPLEQFQRVITVSLETNRIAASLPKLDID